MLREELDCQLPVEVIYNGPLEMTHEVLSRFEARPVPRTGIPQSYLGCSVKGPNIQNPGAFTYTTRSWLAECTADLQGDAECGLLTHSMYPLDLRLCRAMSKQAAQRQHDMKSDGFPRNHTFGLRSVRRNTQGH